MEGIQITIFDVLNKDKDLEYLIGLISVISNNPRLRRSGTIAYAGQYKLKMSKGNFFILKGHKIIGNYS